MSEPNLLQIYGFVNPNGETLQLRLGSIRNELTRKEAESGDTGLRWSFVGKKIPMPVWSGDWFKGHPEPIMTKWLMENGGWAKKFMVDLVANKTEVYDLPKTPIEETEFMEALKEADERLIKKAIRSYFNGDNLPSTMRLWELLTGETCHVKTLHAVKEILDASAKEVVKTETDWIPVNSGKMPDDNVSVQVTYLSPCDGKPLCDAVAYRKDGYWYWCDNGIMAIVKITAWRYCDPYKGMISVEDLWDLSLKNLDAVFKALTAEKKQASEMSLLATKSPEDAILDAKIAIVQHIFDTKVAEADAAKQAATDAAEAQRIMGLIANKKDEALANMTIEELEAKLAELQKK